MPVPKQGLPPSTPAIQAYGEYMLAVQAALREPPAESKALLDGLEPKRRIFGEVEQNLIPNPQGINAARIDLMMARAELCKRSPRSRVS